MDETPGFRPLYRQVYDYLVRQIATGVWRPAEAHWPAAYALLTLAAAPDLAAIVPRHVAVIPRARRYRSG